MPDAETRPDDTAILSITLHQGRHSVLIGKYPFQARDGANIGEVIRRILEEKCPNRDRNE
jgi:hypothetical protein